MDSINPLQNEEKNNNLTGYEAVLGGQLTEKAIWVDESRCI